jgi:short-subunit dehydrogenase
MRRIEGSVVVITGASSGIGRAAATLFAEAGARLVLAARRLDALEEVAAECENAGAEALAVPTDTADADAVHALAEAAVRRFGRIDTWVNDAAVGAYGRFEDMPVEALRRLIDVNVFGYIHGTREALARFRAQEAGGVVIQVASVVGRLPWPFMAAYSATKHAVIGLSLSLAQELAVEGSPIRVCIVNPPSTDTPFHDHAAHYGELTPHVMPPVYAPEHSARAILSVARRPRRQVMVGAVGPAFIAQHALAPGLTERQIGLLADRLLVRRDPTRPRSDGALFEPMAAGRERAAGWQPARPALGRIASFALLVLGGTLLSAPYGGDALAAGVLAAARNLGLGKRRATGRVSSQTAGLPRPALAPDAPALAR